MDSSSTASRRSGRGLGKGWGLLCTPTACLTCAWPCALVLPLPHAAILLPKHGRSPTHSHLASRRRAKSHYGETHPRRAKTHYCRATAHYCRAETCAKTRAATRKATRAATRAESLAAVTWAESRAAMTWAASSTLRVRRHRARLALSGQLTRWTRTTRGRTYMHTCMHACMHACMHGYIHTPGRAHAGLRGRLNALAAPLQRAQLAGTCISTCLHTHIHTYT